jgi:hypothetical protein
MIGVVHDDGQRRKHRASDSRRRSTMSGDGAADIDIVETRLVKRYAPGGDAETICPSAQAGAHEQLRECQELG